jgi:hypothetical protein
LLSQNDVGRNAARTCRHNCNTGIRYNPEFPFCFLTPEVYHQLPLLRSFFLHSFQSNRTRSAGPLPGPKSHDLPHSHCHEAAEAHLAAMAGGSGKSVVPAGLGDLRDFSAENVSNFCGRCHRTWAEVLVATSSVPGTASARGKSCRADGRSTGETAGRQTAERKFQ